MNIKIKNTNLELTPSISDYLNKRLADIAKIVDSHDPFSLCQVEIGKKSRHHKSGDIFRAEINLRLKGRDIYVTADHEDLYASIDKLKNEVMNAVKSYKGKRETLWKRGKMKIKRMMKGLKGGEV